MLSLSMLTLPAPVSDFPLMEEQRFRVPGTVGAAGAVTGAGAVAGGGA